MLIVYCFVGKRSRPRQFTWQYFCVCACMCFYVSNFTPIIHTDSCSILFSSHRVLTSSCRSWRPQDGHQYGKISISVWKIPESFCLYSEFIHLPHFHETYPKTSPLIETFTSAILTLITRWHLSLRSTDYFLPVENALFINRNNFFSQSKLWNNEYWVITTVFEKFICL